MCQKPDIASFTVKYLDCASYGKMSSRVLAYHCFLSIALFKSFGSRHGLRLPSSFITGTIELIHSVCLCTSVMMPSSTSLSNSANHVLFVDTYKWLLICFQCESFTIQEIVELFHSPYSS